MTDQLRPPRVEPVALADVAAACGAHVVGDATVAVTGATLASSDVLAGDLFVALPGANAHGAQYAPAAVAAGAVAVLTDAAGRDLIEAEGADVPVAIVADPRTEAGAAAARIYASPSRSLTIVGITGTNGKTTTSYFTDAALRARHGVTGLLGTVEIRVGEESIPAVRTTMEAPAYQAALAAMRDRGATAVVTEVSSHALDLRRVDGTRYAVAVFTNLQREHLDFHGSMEEYFRAKARLFTPGLSRRGVVLVDDEWGVQLAAQASIPVQTVSTRADAAACGDWHVSDVVLAADGVGSDFTLTGPDGQPHRAHAPLPAAINVSNAATAIVAAHAAGVPVADAIAAIGAAAGVPGRMQRVLERRGPQPLAVVDYAHTPDALARVLEGAREVTEGRVIAVFGAGGDRDPGKRPLMGEAAARLADVLVVTDDNPRTEDPAEIRAQIMQGVAAERPDRADVHEVSPRGDAIRAALRMAAPGDTVVVAGKGHEDYQEIHGVKHHFSDPEQLRDAAAEVFGSEAAR